jgi:hypothetical protein
MELLANSWGSKKRRAVIAKAFIGGDRVLKAGGKKFRLPTDIERSQVGSSQNEMTFWRAVLIVGLSVTVVGIFVAIPLYFAGKRKRMTLSIKAKTGETFTLAAERSSEWRLLQRYAGIGLLA